MWKSQFFWHSNLNEYCLSCHVVTFYVWFINIPNRCKYIVCGDCNKLNFQSRLNTISVEWRIHALQQMSVRNISRAEVLEILFSGETIESYPEDIPYPSFLLKGFVKERPLHVVIAYADHLNVIFVVTAYEPDNQKWDSEFRRRQ